MPIGEVFERNLDGGAKKDAITMRAAFAKVADTGDPAALEEPANVAPPAVAALVLAALAALGALLPSRHMTPGETGHVLRGE